MFIPTFLTFYLASLKNKTWTGSISPSIHCCVLKHTSNIVFGEPVVLDFSDNIIIVRY